MAKTLKELLTERFKKSGQGNGEESAKTKAITSHPDFLKLVEEHSAKHLANEIKSLEKDFLIELIKESETAKDKQKNTEDEDKDLTQDERISKILSDVEDNGGGE